MSPRSAPRHGYTRAYIDREATTEDGPIRFVGATEGAKGDGIDLRMAGAQLARYQANPIVGYAHSYWGRGHLPIGRSVRTWIETKRLLFDVEFDRADEFATTVERKYRDGYLNAVSVGFDVISWAEPHASYWTGGTALEWELFELSSVPLPMDADAVVESGRDGFDAELVGALRARIARLSAEELATLLPAQRHPLSLYSALASAQG